MSPPRAERGAEFAELSRSISDAGLLERRRVAYGFRIALNALFYAAGVTAFVMIGQSWWQMLTAVVLGVAFTQTAFMGHDAGHHQIFASRRANDAVGYLHGNLLVGLSIGWWKGKHNAHHRNPNHEDLDPDVGPGVVAFTDKVARNQGGVVLRAVHRHQAFLFVPLLLLEGLNLHVASVQAIKAGRVRHAALETALLAIHAVAYFGTVFLVLSPLQAAVFIATQQAVFGLYMGATFAPNHKGMPIMKTGQRTDFFRTQVLTARNVGGGPMTSFALGGLNFQIEHHLFPSMPRPNLRIAQPIVRDFCVRHGVAYHQTSLLDSYRQSLRSLFDVGASLRRGVDLQVAGNSSP